jgi:hypothetical protein
MYIHPSPFGNYSTFSLEEVSFLSAEINLA